MQSLMVKELWSDMRHALKVIVFVPELLRYFPIAVVYLAIAYRLQYMLEMALEKHLALRRYRNWESWRLRLRLQIHSVFLMLQKAWEITCCIAPGMKMYAP